MYYWENRLLWLLVAFMIFILWLVLYTWINRNYISEWDTVHCDNIEGVVEYIQPLAWNVMIGGEIIDIREQHCYDISNKQSEYNAKDI